MAKPIHTLVGESLVRVKKVADKGIVSSSNINKIDLARLTETKWLHPIIRGWYMFCQPIADGESTAWYAHYWNFIDRYLNERLGDKYCLAPSSSIDVHLGKTVIPDQLIVIVGAGGTSVIELPFKTSVMMYQDKKAFAEHIEKVRGINVMPLPEALCRSPKKFF